MSGGASRSRPACAPSRNRRAAPILDYNGNGLTGKKTGNDIKEKKITLPLIRALEKASIAQKRHILRIIGNKKKSRQEIDEVIRFVSEKGGLEYASERMYQYHDKAQAILDTYPPSETREALREFVNYTVTREK